LPASKALTKYSRNRRRNSLESTHTDKKNPTRQEIHAVLSGESPPPVTTAWDDPCPGARSTVVERAWAQRQPAAGADQGGWQWRPMILLILSAISLSPLSATMSANLPPTGTSRSASFCPAYLSETYFDEKKDEHVVLILRGVHATAKFVAAFPEGAIEFRFFDGHLLNELSFYHPFATNW
jgi:hypothetical protein